MPRKQKKLKPAKAKKPPRPSLLARWWGGISADSRRALGRGLAWAILTSLCAFGIVTGLKHLERRVLRMKAQATPQPVIVKLASHPAWMPDALAQEIADSLVPPTPAVEPAVTGEVYQRAIASPWIRLVPQVVRQRCAAKPGYYAEVTAQFRRPIARVLTRDASAWYVDAEGYVLPELQVPRWVATTVHDGQPARQVCYLSSSEIPTDLGLAEIHYITIRGVESDPPAPGQPWKGSDLSDGLRLVELVSTRDYANQITMVDVRNAGGRISRNEAYLRLYAQISKGRRTDIRFGRFPMPGGDYVISPERKLGYLDDYVHANGGKLAGLHEYLDLRYDQLHVSVN